LPWLLVPFAVVGLGRGVPGAAVASLAAVALPLTAWRSRRTLADLYAVDSRLWYLQPVGFAVAAAILVNSTWLSIAGRSMSWRGRLVRVGAASVDRSARTAVRRAPHGSHRGDC